MIAIPDYIWDRMLAEFAQTTQRVEQVAYLDGVRLGEEAGVVTTLTIPAAACYSGRFEVSADAMSAAGKHLRAQRLVRLAQVHTHPSAWTGHSPWDDTHAYSQRPGALSIVLPHYGDGKPTLAGSGVHRREVRGWRQLSAAEIAATVRIVPSIINLRDTHESNVEPPRRGFWRSLRAAWSKRTH